MSKFYITTAIHYVNDDPHIGHMYENIAADVMARHRRRMGDDVRFLTGTDEHGQKIERAAAREGISPIELADRVVKTHHELWKKLDISHDDFIRTTEGRHRLGVLELIRRIEERNPGDIYLGEHSGWYCQNEETFIPENQVRDGVDEDGHKVEWTTEQNYFFRLSGYTHRLLAHYREHPEFVWPQTRLNEVVAFVEQGLKDLSISRSSIKWGIPFPGNPDHVIYVWMDALTNYISALGFGSADDADFRHYWPADIHLIGKDIVRFHAVYWPAFLMAAGIELPKRVVGHGFWLRDQQKISKSLGNVVRPYNIIEDFGPDPLRYYVMREMVFGQDQDYSDESLLVRYNADLANDLGNTLSRAIKMCDSYFGGKTPPERCFDNDLMRKAETVVPRYLEQMDELAFQRALEVAWELLVGHQRLHCGPRALEALQGARPGCSALPRHLELSGVAAHRLAHGRAVHAAVDERSVATPRRRPDAHRCRGAAVGRLAIRRPGPRRRSDLSPCRRCPVHRRIEDGTIRAAR